jgi:hypothetical protein
MALKSFADVQAFLNNFISSHNIQVGLPHGAFWNTTYKNFVTGNVPQVLDPSNNPVGILTKGDGAHSNIIYALSGTQGTLWDPNNPQGFGQMPAGGPFMTADMIQELSDWITAGCPETATEVGAEKAAVAALPSFAAVQAFLNNFISSNNIQISGAPHGAFWNTTYSDFVTGNVPGGITDPNGNPISILTKGDGAHSNIIYALAGTPGTLWDPNNPAGFGQMPAGGPFMTADMIAQISGWITNGCPEKAAAAYA